MFFTESGRIISYCGNIYAKDIQRIGGGSRRIDSVDGLFEILLQVWRRETAYPSCQKEYDHTNDPTYGQCAITAMLVCDMFGGTIHKIRVEGGGTHYFNKLNEHYIDLTSDQFDLYGIPVDYEHNNVVRREYCGKNADTQKRYKMLVRAVAEYLDSVDN